MNDNILRTSTYVAATDGELRSAGATTKFAAAINQRVLFPHRGTATLYADRLVFAQWSQERAVTAHPSEVHGITREFTDLYGRFLGGGSKNWGAPVILSLTDGTQIYALFDHRPFLEKTANPAWEQDLLTWWGTEFGHPESAARG